MEPVNTNVEPAQLLLTSVTLVLGITELKTALVLVLLGISIMVPLTAKNVVINVECVSDKLISVQLVPMEKELVTEFVTVILGI